MEDTIYRQQAIDEIKEIYEWHDNVTKERIIEHFEQLPSAQPEYSELKREFILMASYIDSLLECSDLQRETLNGFISRMGKLMPWNGGN